MIPSFVNRCWRSIRLKLFTGCTQRCGVCVCASARVGVSVYGAVRIPHDCMTFSRQQFFVYVCVCVCVYLCNILIIFCAKLNLDTAHFNHTTARTV